MRVTDDQVLSRALRETSEETSVWVATLPDESVVAFIEFQKQSELL
jgi:hypothetical protein